MKESSIRTAEHQGGRITQAAMDDDEIDLMELFRALWRGKWVIAAAALVALFVGAYYALGVAVPQYRSSAKLTLEMRTNQVVDIESVISGVSTETAALNTEIEIILSRRVLGKLVDELGLVEDPSSTRNCARRRACRRSLVRRKGCWAAEDSDNGCPAGIAA